MKTSLLLIALVGLAVICTVDANHKKERKGKNPETTTEAEEQAEAVAEGEEGQAEIPENHPRKEHSRKDRKGKNPVTTTETEAEAVAEGEEVAAEITEHPRKEHSRPQKHHGTSSQQPEAAAVAEGEDAAVTEAADDSSSSKGPFGFPGTGDAGKGGKMPSIGEGGKMPSIGGKDGKMPSFGNSEGKPTGEQAAALLKHFAPSVDVLVRAVRDIHELFR